MRDHLAHRYFDTTHAVLQAAVDHDLPDLEEAVTRPVAGLATQATPPDSSRDTT
jgi:uncharacterized protein with HEPN domain